MKGYISAPFFPFSIQNMTDRSSTEPTHAPSASGFVSPVTKYERLREDELRAQQERLQRVRVSKRKLSADDAAGVASDASRVAFAPVIPVSSTAAATAKKKLRRTTGAKTDAAKSKSIAGVLNNFMKKVETGKRDPSAEMVAHSSKERRFVTFPPPPLPVVSPAAVPQSKAPKGASERIQSPEMFSRAVVRVCERVWWASG